jgi:hypothetical protein
MTLGVIGGDDGFADSTKTLSFRGSPRRRLAALGLPRLWLRREKKQGKSRGEAF